MIFQFYSFALIYLVVAISRSNAQIEAIQSLLWANPKLYSLPRQLPSERILVKMMATTEIDAFHATSPIIDRIYRKVLGIETFSRSSHSAADINQERKRTLTRPFIQRRLDFPLSPETRDGMKTDGQTLHHVISTSILVIKIDPRNISHLSLVHDLTMDPDVDSIEYETMVYASNSETVGKDLWNLDLLSNTRDFQMTGKYWYAFTGENVRVHVLDTGVNIGHEDFEGRARVHYVLPEIVEPLCQPGHDCHGHGSHVAGIVAGRLHGVAKKALIFSSPVLRSQGYGYNTDIISVLNFLIRSPEESGSVVVMSLGGGKSALLAFAIECAAARGITVVVAAGNEHHDACIGSPADSPAAITVASHDPSGKRSSFSNYGNCVDIYAPGDRIRSAGIPERNAYRLMSGTSMATPMVAGVVAQILQQNPDISPSGIKQLLKRHAKLDRVADFREGSNYAVSSKVIATRCIKKPSKTCLFIKGQLKHHLNSSCAVTQMLEDWQMDNSNCTLTSVPSPELLKFYGPILTPFRSNQIRVWLYETETMDQGDAVRINLQITETQQISNGSVKRIIKRSKDAAYPQQASLLFKNGSSYSIHLNLRHQYDDNSSSSSDMHIKYDPLHERNNTSLVPFVLFVELPSHCRMPHAKCENGQCDDDTGLCICGADYEGPTCSPARPVVRKSWKIFTAFPHWYWHVIFGISMGIVHFALYSLLVFSWKLWYSRKRIRI